MGAVVMGRGGSPGRGAFLGGGSVALGGDTIPPPGTRFGQADSMEPILGAALLPSLVGANLGVIGGKNSSLENKMGTDGGEALRRSSALVASRRFH